MSARRTDMHRLQELIRHHRLGLGARECARRLRMGRDTIRTYTRALADAGLLDGPPDALPELEALRTALAERLPSRGAPQQGSSVAEWKPLVAEMYARGAGPTAIHDRLRIEHPGFPGSLSAVKRLCAKLRRERGVRAEDVAIPVETAPGEVAQVDFGYAGKRYDAQQGVMRRSWVFVMVLGHSRHMVAYLVFDQKIETWLALHVRAFEELGGVPRVIVPDNLKSAVIRSAFGVDDEVVLNRSYRELARYYGFQIDPTPPRAPQKKGKVEAGVRYVRGNFLKAREPGDLREDQLALGIWLREVAGKRRHGATGRAPAEVFESEERTALIALPVRRWERVLWKKVRVHRDSHVQIEGGFYSAPWRLMGRELWARCTAHSIALYHEDERLCTHSRVKRGKRATVEQHLPDHRRDLRHRSREYWEARAVRIGADTLGLVRDIFDSDDVLSHLRQVQAIVTHLEGYPRERAEAASRRARHFRSHRYVAVKNILRQGLDLAPLSTAEPRAWSRGARFARKASEFVRNRQEEMYDEHR